MNQIEAIKKLKTLVKPNHTLLVNIVSVSRSGMSRRIKVLTKDFIDISYLVAKAIDFSEDTRKGILVIGCGMDMAFSLMDNLTYALYGQKRMKGFKGNGGSCIAWEVTS